MRLPPLAVLALLLLAGCTGGSDGAGTDAPEDIDFGDAKATDTTGIIRGLVVDLAIRPLPGATILMAQDNRTTTSGADGQFAFDGLQPGTYFLFVSLTNYTTMQTQAEVVAGVDEPPITRILLERLESTRPYLETVTKTGFLTLGASIGITSVGSTIYAGLVDVGEDSAIWNMPFTQVPMWAQGELVWDQTQPGGGMLIWEMVKGDGQNSWRGHRETTTSPALAYWNTTVLQSEAENVTKDGIDYRFFGGPHPLLAPGGPVVPTRESGHPACTTIDTTDFVLGKRSLCAFGYGLTAQQRADAYIHHFYNFAPPEGWRFTVDGEPIVPDE
jgi:hypothetical protein